MEGEILIVERLAHNSETNNFPSPHGPTPANDTHSHVTRSELRESNEFIERCDLGSRPTGSFELPMKVRSRSVDRSPYRQERSL